MIFNNVNCEKLSQDQIVSAQRKITAVIAWLATREDNFHTIKGTNLGGNELELVQSLFLDHVITSETDLKIKIDNNKIYYDCNWIIGSEYKDIRLALSTALKNENNQLVLDVIDILKSKSISANIETYLGKFPKAVDQLLSVCSICQEFASKLDNNDLTGVELFFRVMLDFPIEISIISMRKYIGIERLVKNNLDELFVAMTLHKNMVDIFKD